MNGTWYFENLSHSNTILAVEPDGTRHTVQLGDMNSAAGIALLNAMTRDLAQPSDDHANTDCL